MNLIEKFSVIIPLYNKEREIKRSVTSVLSQSVKDFELIIINDGSTDNGPAMVREFNDPRIKLISQENRGVSAARNRGIAEAKNELISFLDADDEWTADYLETIRGLRKKFPDAGLYATNYQLKKPRGYFRPPKIKGLPAPPWEGIMPDYFKSAYLGEPPVCTSATTIPKKILMVGSFKEGEVLGEDLDLWAHIALDFPICFTWKCCSTYFMNASNRIRLNNIPYKPFPFIKTATRLIKSQQVNSIINIKSLKEYIAQLQFQQIKNSIFTGKKKSARKILRTCSTKRFNLLLWYFFLSVVPYKFIIPARKLKSNLEYLFVGKLIQKS